MKTENMKPENSKGESTKPNNVFELVLIALLAGLMGLASWGLDDQDDQELSANGHRFTGSTRFGGFFIVSKRPGKARK
jgi:hypothetical protein